MNCCCVAPDIRVSSPPSSAHLVNSFLSMIGSFDVSRLLRSSLMAVILLLPTTWVHGQWVSPRPGVPGIQAAPMVASGVQTWQTLPLQTPLQMRPEQQYATATYGAASPFTAPSQQAPAYANPTYIAAPAYSAPAYSPSPPAPRNVVVLPRPSSGWSPRGARNLSPPPPASAPVYSAPTYTAPPPAAAPVYPAPTYVAPSPASPPVAPWQPQAAPAPPPVAAQTYPPAVPTLPPAAQTYPPQTYPPAAQAYPPGVISQPAFDAYAAGNASGNTYGSPPLLLSRSGGRFSAALRESWSRPAAVGRWPYNPPSRFP